MSDIPFPLPPGWEYSTTTETTPEPKPTPSLAAMLQATERARAAFDAQRDHLAAAIRLTAWCIGQKVVETEPVEEVAARDASLRMLVTAFEGLAAQSAPARSGALLDWLTGLPLVADESLPLGEVHLRPHPNLTEETDQP